MKKFLSVILLMIVLTGCASQLQNGEVAVVDKEISEGYTYYYMTSSVLFPMTFDDEYYLVLEQGNVTEAFEVDQLDYEHINIGDELIYKDGELYEKGTY